MTVSAMIPSTMSTMVSAVTATVVTATVMATTVMATTMTAFSHGVCGKRKRRGHCGHQSKFT